MRRKSLHCATHHVKSSTAKIEHPFLSSTRSPGSNSGVDMKTNRKVSEDYMSLCHNTGRGRVHRTAVVLALAVCLLPAVAAAQDEEVPKVDLFVGYQWLNPGGTV